MSLPEFIDHKYTQVTSALSNRKYNKKLAELHQSGAQLIDFPEQDRIAAIAASFIIGRMNGYIFGLMKSAGIIVVASLVILIFIDLNYNILGLVARAAHWTATSLTALATVMLFAYPYSVKADRINNILRNRGLRFVDNGRGNVLLYKEGEIIQYQILYIPGINQN